MYVLLLGGSRFMDQRSKKNGNNYYFFITII